MYMLFYNQHVWRDAHVHADSDFLHECGGIMTVIQRGHVVFVAIGGVVEFDLQETEAFLRTTPTKDPHERVPELLAHAAVQDEIDGVVAKRYNVQNIPQFVVDLKLPLRFRTYNQRQNSLRKFRY